VSVSATSQAEKGTNLKETYLAILKNKSAFHSSASVIKRCYFVSGIVGVNFNSTRCKHCKFGMMILQSGYLSYFIMNAIASEKILENKFLLNLSFT